MFKGLGAMASLLNQAKTIGPKMQAAMEELKTKQVIGEAGGGLVKVTANGVGQTIHVEIDSLLIEKNEWDMVRDLLPGAINDAISKSKELHVQMMQEVTGDLPIPENMEGMFKNILGGN
jgi:DNA-binding YbaB/EbfC family protein